VSDKEQLEQDCEKWFELCYIKDKLIRAERHKVSMLESENKALKDLLNVSRAKSSYPTETWNKRRDEVINE